ncbi:hypothetical protein ENUP19_0078G0031 [Entamoeba nuttalli]|uniref:K Homology domain-containing protein n=2 Tax=Entamoeba nuttalli TaxID=412467 RepID=K2GCW0_ENTNP|nr:hypothetical protein ENU1_091850 [Entamoeba nuttalli P19]EKE40391.1 hypothetical protein ENU1_091850 [Entamoeba nuttalli P19]|eukprot:XP_008857277.1 hypothetical protein ENU1_091850 [Entamoeba nuttalli P19]
MSVTDKIHEEKKPKKKWDLVNEDFLKLLKEKGQNISIAISDPTQALIVVPQKVAIATIGSNDLEDLLAQQKKGTFEYSKNICINHLDQTLRTCLLKTSTHKHLQKEYNILVCVKGNYQPQFEEKEFDPDDSSTYINKCGQIPLYLLVRGDTEKELNRGVNAINEILNGTLTIEIYPPTFKNEEDKTLFYKKIIGKDHQNIQYIEKKTGVQLLVKGSGSEEVYNDSIKPLHFVIVSKVPIALLKAKSLCDNLISHIKDKWYEGKR